MTEKVKLTQEQADAIEKLRKIDIGNSSIVHNTVFVKVTSSNAHIAYDVLSEMSLDDLIKSLYIGYEVEPEFEVGDWVATIHNEAPIICKVKSVQQTVVDSDYLMGSGYERIFNISEIRHATPEEIAEEKQRRWWARHGREVWELRKGDILISHQKQAYTVERISGENVVLREGSDKKMWQIKAVYKVICFAEDRKDLECEEK